MSDLEQTQAIYLEDDDEETDEESTEGKKKIVSFLKVLKQEGYPEKLFPLYDGDNVIGRQEDACNIAIPLKALSRQHACIEIRGENHLIYDKGSRNKTKKGKLFLTPQVRYELKDKDTLLFGDVQCVYIVGEPDNLDDSETGSESGFQTAPTDPVENRGTSHVTTLVYDSEEDEYNSDDSVDLLQPTQAFMPKQDESKRSRINFDMDTDDESERKSPDITVKETPAPRKMQGVLSTVAVLPESGSETDDEKSSPSRKKDGQSNKSGNSRLFQAPTQAFLVDSEGETTEEDSPKKRLLFAATQPFLEEKSKQTGSPQGVVLESDNQEDQDENIPVVEVEEEEDEEDKSHLFANPTLACDLPEDIVESSDEQEAEEENNASTEDPEAETQVFTDSTVAVSDETLDVSAVKGASKTKAGKKEEKVAKGASTVEIKIKEGENDATQEFSDITGGATLAVGNEGECESTQVFDNVTEAETVAVQCEATQVFDEKVTEAETVAVECEATQVFDEKVTEAETVAVECEATQVFDEKVTEAETVAIECEATQVFDEKVTEAETVAIECEATQVFDEKVTEAETVAIECEATQVFDDNMAAEVETMAIDNVADFEKEAETVAVECEATQMFVKKTTKAVKEKSKSTRVFDEKISVAETIETECEATQVLDNVSSNTSSRKECSDSSVETVALECEPTQVFDDVDVGEDNRTESNKSSTAASKTDAKDKDEQKQCFDESDVKNRDKAGNSLTKSKPKCREGEGSGEVLPKRSGRISKRKSAVEDKPVEKIQETATKKGRERRGRGRKKTRDATEELIGSGEEATETKEDKTSTGLDEIDSRVINTKSDRSEAGIEQTVQYNMEGIEQTVQYNMECDEDLQPTQAYCMEADEEESDTLSISEVLEVEDRTPTEEIKILEDTPDILPVPIPPASPHRSAMASPGRRSPSPKKVHFEKRESEVTIDEASGSKLKPKDEISAGKSSGRNRRSLPNLSQPTAPARGRRGRLSENLTIKAEALSSVAVTSKGRRGAKTQKTEMPETAGKGKAAKVISEEDTPPLEEIENVNTQKLEENPANEEETTQVMGRGKRGKRKHHDAQPHTDVSTSAQSDEGEQEKKMAEEAGEVNSRKGKVGRRSQVPVSDEQGMENSEHHEESSSRGRGRRKTKILDDEKEQSRSDTKTAKPGKGKRKIIENSDGEGSEKTDSDNGGRKSLKSRRRGLVEEINEPAVEEIQTDEPPAELETYKRTKGRKSLSNTETESVPAGRKVRTRKSDTTAISKDEEVVARQTSSENVVEDLDLEESKTNQKGSKRSRKKETLNIISEETVKTSGELPSTSSHNTRTKQRTSSEYSEEINEVKNSVENKNETTPSRKGRGKGKIKQTKDDVQENEISDNNSNKKVQRNQRKLVTKQAQDNVAETGGSQESVVSTESIPTRRGRGKTAAKQMVDSQDIQEDSGSKRKSRGRDVSVGRRSASGSQSRESSAGRRSAAESQSRESSVTRDSETDKIISSAKTKGSNKKVKRDQKNTTPVASDTEMSSDSQDSTKPRGASKRGRGRHATEEAKEEVPVKKSKMEPPSTPQQAKKSAKSTDSPSSALRRKSMDPSKPKVMFTGVTDEQGQKVVKDLGGQLVDAVQECTHLVTDKVRRTVKFLCCLARGIPIVNPLWLDSCKSSGMFGDHAPFLIRDEAAQRQYKFVLQKSLEKASEASLLSGYQIHVTKSVKPDPANMKDIITCAGAEYLATLPKKAGDKVVVISCPDDKGACDAAVKAGVTIVNAEFILTGILRQEVAIENYILFQDKKRSRDSSAGGQPSKRRR